ncbi:sulfatase family protein [Pontiella sulfatireligans]|uniref:Choline-sulfatase n=1 Tax=Pontiella sulfatireligans TaxID=2750658 RepID=A0A6C2UFH1_9BACT|nr:sulfatase [Pontiella sulfatireligans]SPS74140.1 sulfatase S1_27 [Kiritimatiellales bacterium]VGO18171.1 Choline-sulfatase [Pontiella sulfatireligans]
MNTSQSFSTSRRAFLGGVGTLAAASPLLSARGAAHGALPNVLFVLVDQWRFSAFSHGEVNDALVQTPNIDNFVAEGLRWRKAYATSPVCTPERAVLMTGLYPHQTGMTHNDLMIPPGNRCFAEVFQQAGYATHYIGKTHYDGEGRYDTVDAEGNTGWLPGDPSRRWRRRGFTTYQGFNRGHNFISTSAGNVAMVDDDGRTMTEVLNRYEPEFQRELAETFIQSNRERPWLCYLSWGPPHTPYDEVPAEYQIYSVSESDRRPNVPAGNPGAGDLADYYAQCAALDDHFGRLMQFLEDEGLKDNTLVVFTSDHGDMHYSQNLEKKGHPEEESCHIPLFMRMPGTIPSGQVSDTLMNGVDVMPTLLSLCGLPSQKTCAGVDKSAAAKGQPMPEVDSIFCPHQGAWRMVRSDRYKLIVRDNTSPMSINSVTELFDMDSDPYEQTNLKDDPARAGVKQQLYDRLVQWIADTGDSWPAAPVKAKGMYTT